MNLPSQPDQALEQRLASLVLDVLIRAGLILAMVMLSLDKGAWCSI